MGLKFRRGTTAQKSGSLAFGEPYVNTDLGTLQIGGATGDITLGASGTGSAGQFSSISGSSIEVSGNATVGGNLTVGGQLQIGDNSSDTVNVVASLSSSLIPQTTNVFDLGSATKIWRDLYISTGSIKFVEGNTVVKSLSAATLTALEVATGSSNVSVTALNSFTSSIDTTTKNKMNADGVISGSSQITYASISSIPVGIVSGSSQTIANLPTGVVSGSTQTIANLPAGTVSGSTQVIGILSSLNTYTGSNDTTNTTQNSRLDQLSTASGSAITRLSALEVETANLETFSGSQLNKDATLATLTASYDGRFTTLGTYTGSVETRFGTLATLTGSNSVKLTNLESFSSSALTRLSALEVETSNLETFSASALTRLSNLEGKDISITLTGDVTGTGTITDLANVSFATTIAANSVALGTDTTGNYMSDLTQGTGVTITHTPGEGSNATIAIGQAVATSSDVRFNSIGVGVAASATPGRIDASNDIVAFSSSDIRFKENIKVIENPIEKIRQISGNTYDWKEENKIEHGYEGNDVGVIAQEIEAVLPQLVQTRENGYKAVKYDKLVALLIEGIKEQQIQIDNLTLQVEELKKQKGL